MIKFKLKYLIVIEKANDNYSAYLPDISGYIATGKTIEDTKKNIAEALSMHLKGMEEDELRSPGPKIKADYITIYYNILEKKNFLNY